jgi:hypothetical protein
MHYAGGNNLMYFLIEGGKGYFYNTAWYNHSRCNEKDCVIIILHKNQGG